MEAIKAKVQECSVDTLKEMAQALMSDHRDGADLVQNVVLDELMVRLPEVDFVAFCEAL